jgi:hypothetical protein
MLRPNESGSPVGSVDNGWSRVCPATGGRRRDADHGKAAGRSSPAMDRKAPLTTKTRPRVASGRGQSQGRNRAEARVRVEPVRIETPVIRRSVRNENSGRGSSDPYGLAAPGRMASSTIRWTIIPATFSGGAAPIRAG